MPVGPMVDMKFILELYSPFVKKKKSNFFTQCETTNIMTNGSRSHHPWPTRFFNAQSVQDLANANRTI